MKQAAPMAWSMPTQPKGRAVSSFKVTKKLPPGTLGAKKLLQRFGEALVCIRHRVTLYVEARYTTVELVPEHVPMRSRAGRMVGVQIGYGKKVLQVQVKAADGDWDPALRLLRLPPSTTRKLGLSDRIGPLQECDRCGIQIHPKNLHLAKLGWMRL